jgi:hypothetical protein
MEIPTQPMALTREAALSGEAGLALGSAAFTPFRAIAWLSMAAVALALLIAAAVSLIILGISL